MKECKFFFEFLIIVFFSLIDLQKELEELKKKSQLMEHEFGEGRAKLKHLYMQKEGDIYIYIAKCREKVIYTYIYMQKEGDIYMQREGDIYLYIHAERRSHSFCF